MFYIETERLILKPFRLTDAEEYFKIISDKDIIKYVPYSSAYTLSTTIEHLKTYSQGDFDRDFYIKICLRETGKIIGAIIAVTMSKDNLDISYFIAPDYRNNGYCTEAMHAFIKHLVDNKWERYRLDFTIEKENIASTFVAKHCNAKPYRELKNAYIYRAVLDNALETL